MTEGIRRRLRACVLITSIPRQKLYTEDNFRQLVVAIEAPPAFFGDLGEFEDQGQRSLVRGTMRIMIKFTFPVDTGNDAIRSGKVEKIFKQIAQELKPEAAYLFTQGGERGGLLVVDMTVSSQIVETAERFSFGLNAKVEMVPVMALEDLEQGLSSIEGIVQRYG